EHCVGKLCWQMAIGELGCVFRRRIKQDALRRELINMVDANPGIDFCSVSHGLFGQCVTDGLGATTRNSPSLAMRCCSEEQACPGISRAPRAACDVRGAACI